MCASYQDTRSSILDRFADCFNDHRESGYAEHSVRQLVAERAFGLCLGYADLNDHEQLRYDPLFAALCGQTDVQGTHVAVKPILEGACRQSDAATIGKRPVYEQLHCARGEMENWIKEQQPYLFVDRTSSVTMQSTYLPSIPTKHFSARLSIKSRPPFHKRFIFRAG